LFGFESIICSVADPFFYEIRIRANIMDYSAAILKIISIPDSRPLVHESFGSKFLLVQEKIRLLSGSGSGFFDRIRIREGNL